MMDLLQQHPLFHAIPEPILQQAITSNQITLKYYKKGYTLHSEGTPCITLDLIQLGHISAYSLSKEGAILKMFGFSNSEVIGANLLFTESPLYPLNIYCDSHCKVIHIHKSALESFLDYRDFSIAFIQLICKTSTALQQKMLAFKSKTLRDNLTSYLLDQARLQNSATIQLRISKKDLADLLGVQRPSLFRELKTMREEGVIDYDHQSITLLNTFMSTYST